MLTTLLCESSYLFAEGAVLVDVVHLLVAQLFEAVTEDGATVLGALAAVGEVLGHVVVKAMVVLGGNRVGLVRSVQLARALQRWRAVDLTGWWETLRFG